MATLERAIEIAARAHAGHKDRGGASYILHPLRVMLRQESDDARIVAVLHDTVEDTDVTLADLRREGFSDHVLQAVALVTHDKKEPYSGYVARIATHPLARSVKLADLEDNSRPDRGMLRVATVKDDLDRMAKYFLSYKFLAGQIGLKVYLAAMRDYD